MKQKRSDERFRDMPETEKNRLVEFALKQLDKANDVVRIEPGQKQKKIITNDSPFVLSPERTLNEPKQIINIDGIKMELEAADLDQDGITGGVEKIQQSFGEGVTPIIQPTELGDTLKELNQDTLEPNTRMSGIDLRTRLHYAEIGSVLALDALVSLGILPTKCLAFTRQKKRLAVSIDGKGREDIVNIVAGKREQDARTGFMGGMGDKFKNFMGVGGQK